MKQLALEKIGQERFLKEAITQFDIEFFKKFSFNGKDGLKLSQQAIEAHILSLDNNLDIQKLLLAMIHQSYELNKYIPNIELLLYKMFCSPISTKEERKGEKDLLIGNIFAQKGLQLPIDVYTSLLQTVTVLPKKKHFKKIVDYLVKYEDVNRIP